MAFVVEQKQTGNYAPKSDMPSGLHLLKITKLENLGMVPVNPLTLADNRKKRQMEGGDPNTVPTSQLMARVYFKNAAGQTITKDYLQSLHPLSGLFALILAVTGKEPGAKFDLDTIIGGKVQAMVIDKVSKMKGTKYTAIHTLIPAPPASAPAPSLPQAATTTTASEAKLEITDDDLPF